MKEENDNKTKASHGGSRKGAGRKKGGHNKTPEEQMTETGKQQRVEAERRMSKAKEDLKSNGTGVLIVHEKGHAQPNNETRRLGTYGNETRRVFEEKFKLGKVIECPPDIENDTIASDKWKELMNAYSDQNENILSILDLSSLKLFVLSWSRYWKAYFEWELNDRRVASIDKDENMELRQILKVMQDEQRYMAGLMPDLCLTPSGRAKTGLLVAKAAESQMNKDQEDAYSALAAFANGD